jgi:hypothetical protein
MIIKSKGRSKTIVGGYFLASGRPDTKRLRRRKRMDFHSKIAKATKRDF